MSESLGKRIADCVSALLSMPSFFSRNISTKPQRVGLAGAARGTNCALRAAKPSCWYRICCPLWSERIAAISRKDKISGPGTGKVSQAVQLSSISEPAATGLGKVPGRCPRQFSIRIDRAEHLASWFGSGSSGLQANSRCACTRAPFWDLRCWCAVDRYPKGWRSIGCDAVEWIKQRRVRGQSRDRKEAAGPAWRSGDRHRALLVPSHR